MDQKIEVGQVWRHYKKVEIGYEILNLGKFQTKNELDEKDCVVYRNIKTGEVWVRPVTDFLEIVYPENVRRFVRLR